jgi:hypothetical protein
MLLYPFPWSRQLLIRLGAWGLDARRPGVPYFTPIRQAEKCELRQEVLVGFDARNGSPSSTRGRTSFDWMRNPQERELGQQIRVRFDPLWAGLPVNHHGHAS